MIRFSIQLKDFVTDAKEPQDLARMSDSEAATLLGEAYSFMPGPVEVEIDGSTAHVTVHHEPSDPDKAIKLYNRAVKHAERGRYDRAISLFTFVTKELPTHPDARRNLGMAYLESGDVGNAEQHILNALRVDCTDAQAFLLLGNIYAKHRDDFARAKEFYRKV